MIELKKSISNPIQTVHIIDNSVIKHTHIFEGVIWHVQQKFVKCFIIPLSRFSYILQLVGLSDIAVKENAVFCLHDRKRLQLFSCLRLNCSQLNKHKFRYIFSDVINPVCSFGTRVEIVVHSIPVYFVMLETSNFP